MLQLKAWRLKTDVLMHWSLWMSPSIMPKDWFCYLHGQGVPCMFDRVWLLSYADSFLEPQMRAGCQVWTESGPTTPGEELNKRCCHLPDTPTPQGNDLTGMKRCSSWSDHFSVGLSGWTGQKLVSIQLLLRWDLSNFLRWYCHDSSHSSLACSAYLW